MEQEILMQDKESELMRLREQNARMKELIAVLTGLAENGEKAAGKNADLEKSLSFYRRQRAKAKMEEDLQRIRKIDPSVVSLDDLGEDYLRLVGNGIDGAAAFLALKGMKDIDKNPVPPAIGSVNSKTAEEREFFTGSELDSLTSADLDNPRILKKAIKSLTKL